MEGNGAGIAGQTTRIDRAVDSFPHAGGPCSCPIGSTSSTDSRALRAKLIAATVEAVAEGGDPRLVESRALA
jgi:hypothetical protein